MEITIKIASPDTLELLHAALEWSQDSIDEEFSDGSGERTAVQYDYHEIVAQIGSMISWDET